MSIILRALKRIQNQEGEEKQSIEAGTGEDFSSGFSPEKAFLSNLAEPSGFARPQYPATAETGDRKDRASRIPRLLIGMLIVLGIVSTGWFLNIIYKNYSHKDRVVQQAREEEKNAVEPAQPEEMAKEAAPEPPPAAETIVLSAATEIPPVDAPKKPPLKSAPPSPRSEDVPTPRKQPVIPETPGQGKLPQEQPVAQEPPAPSEPPPPTPENLETPVLEPGIRDPVAFAEASIDFPRESNEASFVSHREPVEKKARPDLKINAIAWRTEEPKAIVNMQRVYVGDEVEGALVKHIGRKSVIFEFEGEEFEVRF